MGTSDKPSSRYNAVAMGTVANLFPFGKFPDFNILLKGGMDVESFPTARTPDVRRLKIIPYHLFPAGRTFHYYHRFQENPLSGKRPARATFLLL